MCTTVSTYLQCATGCGKKKNKKNGAAALRLMSTKKERGNEGEAGAGGEEWKEVTYLPTYLPT